MNYIKMSSAFSSSNKDFNSNPNPNSKGDEGTNHVSSFLAPESLDALLDSIAYLNSSSTSIPSGSSDGSGSSDQDSLISPVKVSVKNTIACVCAYIIYIFYII